MAPFRRRGKTARNLALAEAALALAKERSAPSSSKRSRGKLLLVGGAVVAAGAAALLKRDKVAGLLPSRSGETTPSEPFPAPSQPSNYDVGGPVANTATAVPAPDPQPDESGAHEPIDEAAEEAAAAAEAAHIGGDPVEYVGEDLDTPADEAFRPLAEAGEGESEGFEQAEADLADNATYRDAGLSGAEAQIEEAIEEADQPFAGETLEGVVSEDEGSEPEGPAEEEPAQGTFLPPTPEPAAEPEGEAEAPAPEAEAEAPPEAGTPELEPDPAAEAGKDDDEPDDWRTWSGRAVNP